MQRPFFVSVNLACQLSGMSDMIARLGSLKIMSVCAVLRSTDTATL